MIHQCFWKANFGILGGVYNHQFTPYTYWITNSLFPVVLDYIFAVSLINKLRKPYFSNIYILKV